MINVSMRMAETLERLGLQDKKTSFKRSIKYLMYSMEKELYERKGTETWYGIDRQLREAQKEKEERSKSRKGVLRLCRDNRPTYGQENQTKS